MIEEYKYYNFENTMKWLNFAHFLRNEYPFNRKDLENIKAGWGMIIIPKKGIEETIEARNIYQDILERLKSGKYE